MKLGFVDRRGGDGVRGELKRKIRIEIDGCG